MRRPLLPANNHVKGGGGKGAADTEFEQAKKDAITSELNKEFAVMPVGGQVVIMREHVGRNKDEFVLWGVESLKLWLANQPWVSVGKTDDDGNTKKVSVDKFWVASPARRQYNDIVFCPREEVSDAYYNLWKGFGVEQDTSGDSESKCDLFLAHIRDNVAEGNEDRYNYVIGWFAQMFQKPQEKPGVSLVLRGKHGVGKTIVGKTIGRLLGKHYVDVADLEQAISKFNSLILSAILLQVDEGFWAGDKKAEGKLKDLITNETQWIQFKFRDLIRVGNFIRLMITGNPDWVAPVPWRWKTDALPCFRSGKNTRKTIPTLTPS